MTLPQFVWMIIFPLLGTPLAYLGGQIERREEKDPSKLVVARWVAFLALALAWLPFSAAAHDLLVNGPATFAYGNITLKLDGVSLLLAAVVLGLGMAATLFSGPYVAGEASEEKHHALLLATVGVIIGLGCANDLFNLWVWFEAMAIATYFLVAFYRSQPASLESGVKYLTQSATGSALVLVGIALVFAQTGVLGLDQIRTAVAANPRAPLLIAGGALLLIGFGVKAALVPLHTWLPDAHAQAPSGISAMLSGVVIEAGLVALLRAVGVLSGTASWGALLLGFGALNMLAGNLLALRQTQVKRLLAFSSLSHMGYMLVGLGIAIQVGQPAGAQGAFFHLINHGLMKGLAFLAAGAFLYTLYISNGQHGPLTISDLNGAAKRYPLPALALSIAVLGLGGLPPLSGFMSKWQIFVAGFQSGQVVLYGVVIFAALNSVLSLAYYAPIVNAVYREQPSAAVQQGRPLPALITFTLAVLGLAIVLLGFWPSLAQGLTQPAAQALLGMFGR